MLAFMVLDLALAWLAANAVWLSIGLTVSHATEELVAGPLWQYFEKAGGRHVPDGIGFAVFTVGLVLATSVVSWFAYDGSYAWANGATSQREFVVGLLIGMRIGDTLFSHYLLSLVVPGRNPGIVTTAGYVVEAAVLAHVAGCDPLGALAGAAVFVFVNPVVGVDAWFRGSYWRVS
jgi:hypothetical protein